MYGVVMCRRGLGVRYWVAGNWVELGGGSKALKGVQKIDANLQNVV